MEDFQSLSEQENGVYVLPLFCKIPRCQAIAATSAVLVANGILTSNLQNFTLTFARVSYVRSF